MLSAYSPDWRVEFETERAALAQVFPAPHFLIEHIGSTAVPGLGAKPIIDMLLGARSLAEIEAKIPATQALGYQYMPEHETVLPERRFFAKPVIRPRHFHLHAVAANSEFFADHLLFRDTLRADAGVAADYFALKVDLAVCFGDDREGYTEAKSSFIRAAIARARSRSGTRS